MPQVDFYILPENDQQKRWEFSARLAEKAYDRGLDVLILAPNESTAEYLDTLLWSRNPSSFIPHCNIERSHQYSPVGISTKTSDSQHKGILINLGDATPEHTHRFQRLAEIVIQSPEVLAGTRKLYSSYKSLGYSPNTHKIS